METSLTEKESFELISRMINSARNNLQKGTGDVFLLWGYLIAAVSLANLIIYLLLPPAINHYSFYVWFATPLGLVVHFFLIRKMIRQEMVRTYVDQVMGYAWTAFGISVFTLSAAMLLASIQGFTQRDDNLFSFLNYIHWMFMIPFMLILYGFALFISGKAYRFKPLVIGALICWAFTLALFILKSDYFMKAQLMVLIIAVISGFVIPGHLLKIKEKKDVQGT